MLSIENANGETVNFHSPASGMDFGGNKVAFQKTCTSSTIPSETPSERCELALTGSEYAELVPLGMGLLAVGGLVAAGVSATKRKRDSQIPTGPVR